MPARRLLRGTKLKAFWSQVIYESLMTEPDPSILPVRRPTCSRCGGKMAAIRAEAGPEGFEQYTFECNRCGLRDVKIVASDPLKSDAVGWLSGELCHSRDDYP